MHCIKRQELAPGWIPESVAESGPGRHMWAPPHPPGMGRASPILTVLSRVADGDLGLRALALAVDGLDFDLIRHKGRRIGHHQEGVTDDLFLPGPLHLLGAPLHSILNLGGIPVHPPQRLEGGAEKKLGGQGPRSLGQPVLWGDSKPLSPDLRSRGEFGPGPSPSK